MQPYSKELLLTIKKGHYEPLRNRFHFDLVLSDVQMKEAVNKFKTVLKSNNAEILNEENWGLRKLAYPIEKIHRIYQLLEFTAERK